MTGGPGRRDPLVSCSGPGGTIYLSAEQPVYAVDPKGEMRWTYEADGEVFRLSSPAVASDGTIYVGGTDGLFVSTC